MMASKGAASGIPILIFGMLFFPPLFGPLVPRAFELLLYFSAAFIVVVWSIGNEGWRRASTGFTGSTWFILAVYAPLSAVFASSNSNVTLNLIMLFTTILLMLLGSISITWIEAALKVLSLYLLVHAIATIVFYLFPELYFGFFKPQFFPDRIGANGYMSGLTSHYSYNAMFCTLGMLVSSVKAIYGNWDSTKAWQRWILPAVFLFALFLTTKRAHILFGVLAVVLVYLFSNGRGKFLKVVTGGMAGFVVLYWVASFSPGVASALDRITGTFASDDLREVTSGRTLLWEAAIQGWRERPLFGSGWGSFHFIWPDGRTESFHAHSQILNTLYEAGAVGAIIYVVGLVASLVLSARTLRRAKDAEDGSLNLALFAAFAFSVQIFFVVYANTSGELLTSAYVFMPYFLSVAIVIAINNHLSEQVTPGVYSGFRRR